MSSCIGTSKFDTADHFELVHIQISDMLPDLFKKSFCSLNWSCAWVQCPLSPPKCFEISNRGTGYCIIWITDFLYNIWANKQTQTQVYCSPQCNSLCVFILVPLPSIHFSPSLTRGERRQWQGSLHHKTPVGHRPQQLPHKITDTMSASKWTGPVCHTADGGRLRQKGRRGARGISGKIRKKGTEL